MHSKEFEAKVLELFDQQMNFVNLHLATSFKRFNEAKARCIQEFHEASGIPSEIFENHILDQMVRDLT